MICACGKSDCQIPYGFCHCGCGEKTTVPIWSNKSKGQIRGIPVLYVRSHNNVGKGNAKPRPEPRREVVDGVPCVWMPLANGNWTLIWAVDFTEEIKAINWKQSKSGYVVNNSLGRNGKSIFLHKLICPTSDDLEGDHQNHNRLDNRRSNLRPATHQQNCWNSSLSRRNTSGCRGVGETPFGLWRARMYISGKEILLGTFKEKSLAIACRKSAEERLHGQFQSAD